jgi:O-antigen/teichoic acid export membrane protein
MYTGGLYGLERQKSLNIAVAGLSLARYGGVVAILYFVSATPVAFFCWQLGFSVMQLALFALMLWFYLPSGTRTARFSRKALSEVSGFTSGMLVTAVSSFILSQMDKFVLSKFLPFSAVGTYQVGNQISNGVRMLPGFIDSVVLPRFSVYSESGDEGTLRSVYHEAGQIVAIMTIPAATILALFSQTLILLWLGNYGIARTAAPIASIMVAGSALNAFVRVPYALTVARGWVVYGLYEFFYTLVVFIPCLIYFVTRWGGVGAASAWLVINIGYVAVISPFIHYRVLKGEYCRWLLGDVALPAGVCILVAGGGALMMPSGMTRLSQLGYVAACSATCLAACVIALPYGRSNAVSLWRRLRRDLVTDYGYDL